MMKSKYAYAPPRSSLRSLGTFLAGATVAIFGLGIPTIALIDYGMSGDPRAINIGQFPFVAGDKAAQEPGFSVRNFAAASVSSGDQNTLDTLSIAEIAAIAPGSGAALAVEITAGETPLLAALNQSRRQLDIVENAAWRVQLASLKSQTDAELTWAKLRRANPDLLDDLNLHVQSTRLTKGTFYRLQAGPLADHATATSLCNSLKTRRQDCLIVGPLRR